MINKAFKIIEDQLFETLSKNEFQMSKKDSCLTFWNKNMLYKIEFDKNSNQFQLSSSSAENGVASDNFSNISVWFFDPATYTEKDAKSIASDFLETISGPKQKTKIKGSSKKSGEQNNTNITFFINRLVTVFPELKDAIKKEKETFEEFRNINFIRENVLPLIKNSLSENKKNDKIKKLCSTLNASYSTANLDVRSAITIVILNSIEEPKNKELILSFLSEDLKKAWNAAQKYKGKTVKPEKIKKRKSFLAKTLETASKQ